ncbi:hypothetical protein DH2020_040117 [Rehmannia glutinosa]|uniref:Inositol polyphosphate-related phosphatase domain-containing protein n=1 Tax=Rehmannia glutinosa TaxID=99300 RepID=A0ABR0UTW8_REHGL
MNFTRIITQKVAFYFYFPLFFFSFFYLELVLIGLVLKSAFVPRRKKICSDDVVVPEELSEEWLMETSNEIERPGFDQLAPPDSSSSNLRMFVGTWNVGGKTPDDGLNLSDWLKTKAPADIYVLGFQEIVPLNAGNVLGQEDSIPATKWLSLIRQSLNGDTINNSPSKQSLRMNDDQRHRKVKPRVSSSDLFSSDDEIELSLRSSSCSSEEGSPSPSDQHKYCLAASKQMGSISISMTLHQTTFCFVCTHLASGEKEGDAIRRNLDVMEILKRTRFSHSFLGPGKPNPPDNILDHDKIIWLGDLNYRLACICGDTYKLLERNDWQALLEKDQLRIEQKAGRVFKGWEEGEIYFAPTYKYIKNSDQYVAQISTPKEKRRTPAWQLDNYNYLRQESLMRKSQPYLLTSVIHTFPSLLVLHYLRKILGILEVHSQSITSTMEAVSSFRAWLWKSSKLRVGFGKRLIHRIELLQVPPLAYSRERGRAEK